MPFPLCRQKFYVKGLADMTYEEKKAAEPAALTVREMVVKHGVNPIDVTGLEKWSHLEVAGSVGVVDNRLEENGVIFECAEGTRLWLEPSSSDGKHFTIDRAPWNLTEGGPYGPFIDTTCRPWENMEPPMSEYDWLKANEPAAWEKIEWVQIKVKVAEPLTNPPYRNLPRRNPPEEKC